MTTPSRLAALQPASRPGSPATAPRPRPSQRAGSGDPALVGRVRAGEPGGDP